jgi:hypothetical protein
MACKAASAGLEERTTFLADLGFPLALSPDIAQIHAGKWRPGRDFHRHLKSVTIVVAGEGKEAGTVSV